MKKKLTIAALALTLALPAAAQNWSIGVGSGAFVFGDFVERRVRPVAGDTSEGSFTQTLSADTRAGLSVDIERSFSERWAVRLEGTFTRAPLSIKEQGGDAEFELEAGEMDVTTFALPIVFRINRGGALRFHLMAGPAYAIYSPERSANAGSNISVFADARSRWGAVAGLGADWHLSERFAIEGAISDIVTASPFERRDFPDVPGFHIPKPHNVHTTLGVRYRF